MRLVFLTPHFAPDVAPTGAVATRLVAELAERGHEIEVVTALPWYREHRIEAAWRGKLVRFEDTPWGRIARVHPFPVADKQSIFKRALAFGGFSMLAAQIAARGPNVDVVIAMSPPLTLGVSGWFAARRRDAAFVLNVQDIYPDIVTELGLLTNKAIVRGLQATERFLYRRADAVTALSLDQQRNVAGKVPSADVEVIPNFVDLEVIKPARKENSYRKEHGLEGKTVVMYAGNIGFSQALEPVIDSAAALTHDEDVVFVINGQGATRPALQAKAADLPNVRFVDLQPSERLGEVLAAADIHLVPLKRGLSQSSFPSKVYSILAAGRPLIACVDARSALADLIERSGGGVVVPAEDAESLTKEIRNLIRAPSDLQRMGKAGRRFVQTAASPAAVAESYESLFKRIAR
ncbi:MAG TPA: glycosyltransferase family 4 protein [Actinomycetota bacterium]|nr:glycosyltransferase family 4 protein [Actinomycetota bacterium]